MKVANHIERIATLIVHRKDPKGCCGNSTLSLAHISEHCIINNQDFGNNDE